MGDFAVTDFTFNAQIHIHRWQKNTITEIKSRNATRGKKRIKLSSGHHGFSRRLSVFGIAALDCAFIGAQITRDDRRITSDRFRRAFGNNMSRFETVNAIRN